MNASCDSPIARKFWYRAIRGSLRSPIFLRVPFGVLYVTFLIAAAASPFASSAVALELDWCRVVPLEATFCRAFPLATPRTNLRLALADTESRRERGLMGVRRIPAGEGMLFVFPEVADRRHAFWMKDTLLPLDMIFVGVDGTVDDVGTNVPAPKPGTPDDRVARHVGFGRYVIELPSGGAARSGLKVGVHLALPVLPAS